MKASRAARVRCCLTGMLLIMVTRALPAQTQVVARADSAWTVGDRALAHRLYSEVVARNPSQSHAVFRLAQLEQDRHQSLALYERYTRLEPGDAWGEMAFGDALARAERFGDALLAYDRAERLAPRERDVAIGRARVLDGAGRPDAAAGMLERWLITHGGDAEAWDLLGRENLRRGRPRAASAAFVRAESSGQRRGIDERMQLARLQRAPAVEPVTAYQGDSDNDRTWRFGLSADVAAGDGVRIGAIGERIRTEDVASVVTGTDAAVRATARPTSAMQLQLQAGMTRYDGSIEGAAWSSLTGEFRLRLRSPVKGPAFDLRAQRTPLGTSPLLIANRAVRNEARATLELPVGPLRLSGSGRAGNVTTLGEAVNTRVGGDAKLALPLGSRVALSAQYHRLGYGRPSSAGYFAPSLVETKEAGLYLETGDEGVTFAADLGAGAQRVRQHGATGGAWARALRGWSYLTIPIAPGRGRALWIETEAYDAPFATEGVSTSASWRFLSVSLGFRVAL